MAVIGSITPKKSQRQYTVMDVRRMTEKDVFRLMAGEPPEDFENGVFLEDERRAQEEELKPRLRPFDPWHPSDWIIDHVDPLYFIAGFFMFIFGVIVVLKLLIGR